MKRYLVWAVTAYLFFHASLWGQSLAELAKKERARRQKIEDKSEVVTEESLRDAAGWTVSTMGEGPREFVASMETEAGQPESAEAKPAAGNRLSELKRSYDNRLSQAVSKVKNAQNDVATCADRDKRYAIDAMGALHDMGRERCAEARGRLDEAQEALKRVQNECLNEARKMSILPGDARTVCFPRS